MVNSGSFDSADGNRNGKTRCTQASDAALGSQSSDADDAACKSGCSKSADGDLPSDESAIEPTPTKTEINSSMPSDASQKNDFPAKDGKGTPCCSLPLDKTQNISPPDNSDDKTKQTRKLICLYCDRSFVSVNLRQKHVERVHSVKPSRRVSARRQNQLSVTPCVHCDKLNASEHTLNDLFQHLIQEHSTKYFGCLPCEERFLTSIHLSDHNKSKHLAKETLKLDLPIASQIGDDAGSVSSIDNGSNKVTRSKVRTNTIDPLGEDSSGVAKRKKSKLKELRNKKISVKTSKIAIKRSKRLQQQAKEHDSQKKRRDKKVSSTPKPEAPSSAKQPDKSKPPCVNPYPEFDNFYRVKKITDHSIDNLKISSLTFDDVFDKAFFNRIQCNIEENLLHHIDGKLFKNEESESRISNFEKVSTLTQEIQNSSADTYGCELSLNAITPVSSLSLSSQFGEDFESQIEYGSKPSKKKTQVKSDEVHYKYLTRRKYQASILQQRENRDLSKLDMWTQMVVKERQEKMLNKKKSAKEIQEYATGQEFKSKIKRQELNRILDRRGPFEDLKEEASKKAAFDKLNSSSESDISQEMFSDVREVLNDLLNRVYEAVEEDDRPLESSFKEADKREVPMFLDLRRKTSSTQEEVDKSDRIALICSSQETENFELPTNTVRGKHELAELTGEWARSRMYICASCGGKFSNMKYLLEHKSLYHQNVWGQHYEFVGNQSELYRHLSIPGLGKVGIVEQTVPCKQWKRSDARTCTKCGKLCNALGELHRHVLECGGDWTWMLARKKCKYRPFGAKSRRKRRGFEPRIHNKRKADPSEKKIYKKPLDGPRQRPSDADTIQRMLANLPAKRSRRSLISLSDVVFKSRKTKNMNSTQSLPATKAKCGKAIHNKQQTDSSKHNSNQQRTSRALRSFSKVLSSRILDLNSSLLVKRKIQVMRNQRSTRNKTQLKSNDLEVTSKETSLEGDLIEPVPEPSQTLKQRKSAKKELVTLKEPKELDGNLANSKTKSVTKRMINSRLNLKNFFPIKKKNIRSVPKISELDTFSVDSENVLENDASTNSDKKSKYLENFRHMKNNKRGGLKGFVRALSLRKRNSKEEELLAITDAKNSSSNNDIQTKQETTKKSGRLKSKQMSLPTKADEDNTQCASTSKEKVEVLSKKRKLQRSFRNVINKMKKVKTDKASNKTDHNTHLNNLKNDNQEHSFLEETPLETDSPSPKKVVPLAEVKENIQGKQNHAHIADWKENSASDAIFTLENNEANSSQAKSESEDFDNKHSDLTDTGPVISENLDGKSSPIPLNLDSKTAPVAIDITFKPKCVPLISPNIKGKMRKPSRGLNDCIAMLTNKLQHKDEKLSSSLESLFSTSSTTSVEPRTESRPLLDSITASIKLTKHENIPKIPTLSVKSPVIEETALDLSKKSCSTPNLLISSFNDSENVLENKDKEVFNKKPETSTWTSVDDIIQQVVQNSTTYVFNRPEKKVFFTSNTNLDDTIDSVVNSSLDWFESRHTNTTEKPKHQKKSRRKKHSDDNLITNIIFGKDKLMIAPSSNPNNLKDPLIAKIKENEYKMSNLLSSSSRVIAHQESVNTSPSKPEIPFIPIDSYFSPILHAPVGTNLLIEKESGNNEVIVSTDNNSLTSVSVDANAINKVDNQQSIDLSQVVNVKLPLENDAETSITGIEKDIQLQLDLEENTPETCSLKEDINTKSPIGNNAEKSQTVIEQNIDREKKYSETLSSLKEDENTKEIVPYVDTIKEASDTSILEEDKPIIKTVKLKVSSKKIINKRRGKERKARLQNDLERPLIVTDLDDDVNFKIVANKECDKTLNLLLNTNSCTSTNKTIEISTESEPILLENKIIEQTAKLPSDSEDEVPLSIIAKLDEVCLLQQNFTPADKSLATENQQDKSKLNQAADKPSDSVTEIEEPIQNNPCHTDYLNDTKDIAETLTTDSLKENLEETDIQNNTLNEIKELTTGHVKIPNIIKTIKKKKRRKVFAKNKRRIPQKKSQITELDTSTDSGREKADEESAITYADAVLKPMDEHTNLPVSDTSIPVASDSDQPKLSTDVKNALPVKKVNSQRTRRKSKCSKKIDKMDNELFKDFSLVINKKTKRIPPTSIVDDSVCDDILDANINFFVKPPEVGKECGLENTDVITELPLNDSVEEMDMEIEDIPIKSNIIERDYKHIATLVSYEEEKPCVSEDDLQNCLSEVKGPPTTRKSPRKKNSLDLDAQAGTSNKDIVKVEINHEVPKRKRNSKKCILEQDLCTKSSNSDENYLDNYIGNQDLLKKNTDLMPSIIKGKSAEDSQELTGIKDINIEDVKEKTTPCMSEAPLIITDIEASECNGVATSEQQPTNKSLKKVRSTKRNKNLSINSVELESSIMAAEDLQKSKDELENNVITKTHNDELMDSLQIADKNNLKKITNDVKQVDSPTKTPNERLTSIFNKFANDNNSVQESNTESTGLSYGYTLLEETELQRNDLTSSCVKEIVGSSSVDNISVYKKSEENQSQPIETEPKGNYKKTLECLKTDNPDNGNGWIDISTISKHFEMPLKESTPKKKRSRSCRSNKEIKKTNTGASTFELTLPLEGHDKDSSDQNNQFAINDLSSYNTRKSRKLKNCDESNIVPTSDIIISKTDLSSQLSQSISSTQDPNINTETREKPTFVPTLDELINVKIPDAVSVEEPSETIISKRASRRQNLDESSISAVEIMESMVNVCNLLDTDDNNTSPVSQTITTGESKSCLPENKVGECVTGKKGSRKAKHANTDIDMNLLMPDPQPDNLILNMNEASHDEFKAISKLCPSETNVKECLTLTSKRDFRKIKNANTDLEMKLILPDSQSENLILNTTESSHDESKAISKLCPSETNVEECLTSRKSSRKTKHANTDVNMKLIVPDLQSEDLILNTNEAAHDESKAISKLFSSENNVGECLTSKKGSQKTKHANTDVDIKLILPDPQSEDIIINTTETSHDESKALDVDISSDISSKDIFEETIPKTRRLVNSTEKDAINPITQMFDVREKSSRPVVSNALPLEALNSDANIATIEVVDGPSRFEKPLKTQYRKKTSRRGKHNLTDANKSSFNIGSDKLENEDFNNTTHLETIDTDDTPLVEYLPDTQLLSQNILNPMQIKNLAEDFGFLEEEQKKLVLKKYSGKRSKIHFNKRKSSEVIVNSTIRTTNNGSSSDSIALLSDFLTDNLSKSETKKFCKQEHNDTFLSLDESKICRKNYDNLLNQSDGDLSVNSENSEKYDNLLNQSDGDLSVYSENTEKFTNSTVLSVQKKIEKDASPQKSNGQKSHIKSRSKQKKHKNKDADIGMQIYENVTSAVDNSLSTELNNIVLEIVNKTTNSGRKSKRIQNNTSAEIAEEGNSNDVVALSQSSLEEPIDVKTALLLSDNGDKLNSYEEQIKNDFHKTKCINVKNSESLGGCEVDISTRILDPTNLTNINEIAKDNVEFKKTLEDQHLDPADPIKSGDSFKLTTPEIDNCERKTKKGKKSSNLLNSTIEMSTLEKSIISESHSNSNIYVDGIETKSKRPRKIINYNEENLEKIAMELSKVIKSQDLKVNASVLLATKKNKRLKKNVENIDNFSGSSNLLNNSDLNKDISNKNKAEESLEELEDKSFNVEMKPINNEIDSIEIDSTAINFKGVNLTGPAGEFDIPKTNNTVYEEDKEYTKPTNNDQYPLGVSMVFKITEFSEIPKLVVDIHHTDQIDQKLQEHIFSTLACDVADLTTPIHKSSFSEPVLKIETDKNKENIRQIKSNNIISEDVKCTALQPLTVEDMSDIGKSSDNDLSSTDVVPSNSASDLCNDESSLPIKNFVDNKNTRKGNQKAVNNISKNKHQFEISLIELENLEAKSNAEAHTNPQKKLECLQTNLQDKIIENLETESMRHSYTHFEECLSTISQYDDKNKASEVVNSNGNLVGEDLVSLENNIDKPSENIEDYYNCIGRYNRRSRKNINYNEELLLNAAESIPNKNNADIKNKKSDRHKKIITEEERTVKQKTSGTLFETDLHLCSEAVKVVENIDLEIRTTDRVQLQKQKVKSKNKKIISICDVELKDTIKESTVDPVKPSTSKDIFEFEECTLNEDENLNNTSSLEKVTRKTSQNLTDINEKTLKEVNVLTSETEFNYFSKDNNETTSENQSKNKSKNEINKAVNTIEPSADAQPTKKLITSPNTTKVQKSWTERKIKKPLKNNMDIDIANILDSDNDSTNRRSPRKRKTLNEKSSDLPSVMTEDNSSPLAIKSNFVIEKGSLLNDTCITVSEIDKESKNEKISFRETILETNLTSESEHDFRMLIDLPEMHSSDSNESLPLLERMNVFQNKLPVTVNKSTENTLPRDSNISTKCSLDDTIIPKDSLPIISVSSTDDLFKVTESCFPIIDDKLVPGDLVNVLPVSGTESMEDVILETKCLSFSTKDKRKLKRDKPSKISCEDLHLDDFLSEASKTNISYSKSDQPQNEKPEREYQLAKINIKDLLLSSLAPPNSTPIGSEQISPESSQVTKLENKYKVIERSSDLNISEPLVKSSKLKTKKLKGKKARHLTQNGADVIQDNNAGKQKKKSTLSKSLSFTTIKNVLSTFTNTTKKNIFKKSEDMFSEIQPLTEIITSSEMDIAPVLDEIDKSLESEDIYDFNEDINGESFSIERHKTINKKSKSRSKSCPKPEVLTKTPIEPDLESNKRISRTAKVKALGFIHQTSLTKSPDVELNITPEVQPSNSKKRSKSLNATKEVDTIIDSDENIDIIKDRVDAFQEVVNNTSTKQHQTNLLNELKVNSSISETSVVQFKKLVKTELTSTNLMSQDLNENIDPTEEMLPLEHQHPDQHLFDNDGLELRRSRRGSRKVASYNENDLIDPLIDALENRRSRSARKDKSTEKHQATEKTQAPKTDTSKETIIEKTKLSSEELFDLLKNSSYENENINISKPHNSFFDNLNDTSSNGADQDRNEEDYNIINEKDFIGSPKIEHADKIYEFSEESPDNTEKIKELFAKSKKKSKQSVLDEVKGISELPASIENNSTCGVLEYVVLEKERDDDEGKSNYCSICKKSFIRVENLIKHQTTLTHISKLSELEAKQAEEKTRLQKPITEEPSNPPLQEIGPLRDNINITHILQQSDRSQVSIQQESPNLHNNQSLKLVDIISDVLNKPVLENYIPDRHDFSPSHIQPKANSDIKRFKNLGERKSFESENHISQINKPTSYLPSTLSQTTILEKQINLLENIIGNNLENITSNELKTTNDFIDEISSCSNNSNVSDLDNSCTSNRSAFNINSEPVEANSDADFIKPTQYEEISEDSASARVYDDPKQRKTLNRDEELFLECCSLLKSGSEVSNSNYSKKLKKPINGCNEYDDPEVMENNKLIQPEEEAHEYSDNSRTPTPLGDTYDDEASNSNTISSNWHLNSEKTLDKNRSFSFEEVKNKEAAGMSFSEILTKGLRNQFENVVKADERSKEDSLQVVVPENFHPDDKKDDSDSSTASKKVATKGARKVYEGLKVSIPTEDLNLDVLNSSPLNKKSEMKTTPTSEDQLEINHTKPRSTRKSKPVKKSQVGSNLLFKVNKKKSSTQVTNFTPAEKQDIYNFEDTQDNNTDVFVKPTFKEVNNATVDIRKDIIISSDNDSLGYADSIGADAKSVSSVSSISAMSARKPETTAENITKKKYKIMGKIFRNAAKSKVDENIDEELRSIPEIPEIDNLELVENYVLSCQRVKSPFLPPPPPLPLDEAPKKPKMTEEEMNMLFDQLLGKEVNEAKQEKQTNKHSSKIKSDPKNGDAKKKYTKVKNRKRHRANSESSDDEFNINKTAKKRTNKKINQDDSGINLELELKECIGVASRKSQRSCTSGKQNILVEYWSSDEEAFEAMLESHKAKKEEDKKKVENKKAEVNVLPNLPNEPNNKILEKPLIKAVKSKLIKKRPQSAKIKKTANAKKSTVSAAAVASNRRKRAAANPLYHWSSSSEDESQSLIEVKPIREEDEDDRPIQHGWIVGDSPKKLVTMLALTKGKKTDIDSVKEQGKRRTSNTAS